MFCSHCGKEIDEAKIEKSKSSYSLSDEAICSDTKISYVCPQCGYLIHNDLDKEEIKSLSRASHAQLQRSSNNISSGLCYSAIGAILLIIGIIFFILAKKPSNGHKLVVTCAEFYISIILLTISLILLGFGVYKLVIGLNKKKTYTKVLKDINNDTFVQ